MNIAQLSEHLKDIPQPTLIGYAQNPNSVVPQFLALAEIQRRQQLQAPAQPPQSTVANDVLAQANPQPAPMAAPQGIAAIPQQAPQQLPENQPGVAQLPSGMGQGFAGGGIVAFAGGGMPDAEDDEDYADYVDSVEKSKRRSKIDEVLASVKDRVAGVVGALPKSYEETKKQYATPSSDDNSEGFLSKLEHLESRGKHFDSKGNILTSPKGALGIMQTMPNTLKNPGFGITPAKDRSPEELQRVGREYGLAMLNEFKDPKLAAMAYNWGPGNVKKWLESDRTIPVPKETRQYASHFAQGGIAHFATGDKISQADYDASSNADDQMFAAPAVAPTPEAPVQASASDLFLKRLTEERDQINQEHANDKKLAMLQAGLAMMGGSSPYAFQNIGQGGVQGIAAYQAAQKQRGAELSALRKAEASAIENQFLGDIRKLGIEERSAASKAATEERAYGRQERSQLLATKEANDVREAALARFNADPMTKQLAKKLEETTPGTPEFEWYTNEFNRLRNNALAAASVPGVKSAPKSSPFPSAKVDVPGSLSSWWNNYTKEDLDALKWANENPLDPRANLIKEKFK